MMHKTMTIAFLILMTATGLAAADFSPKFYLGAGLGGDVDAGSFRDGLERFSTAEDDPWKAFAGVAIGRHLAFEVSRYEFGTQRCCPQVADIGFLSTVDGFAAAALGRWPIGRFTPYVKAGVLAWEEDGEFVTLIGTFPRSADGTDLLYGAGLDFDLAKRFAVRADWERYDFGGASSDGLWASLLVRF